MSNGTREKQALGVFLILIVLSTFGIAWYMVAGHSWNVAASSIDEKVGQMEGYTSIVYAGTLPVQADARTLDSQNGFDAQLEEGVGSADAAEKADEGVSGSGSGSASSACPDTAASSTSSDTAASASSSGGSAAPSSADKNASVNGASSSTGSSNGSNTSSSSKGALGQTKSSDGLAGQTHNDEASGLTSDVGSVAALSPIPANGTMTNLIELPITRRC